MAIAKKGGRLSSDGRNKLSLLLASDAAAMTGQGPYHLPLMARGEVSAFRFLGPLRPGVELISYEAPMNGAEESRLI